MANYPKELTDLLQEYLTDRIITDDERMVLLRKAATLGVDQYEFNLYINAQLQKLDNQYEASQAAKKGRICPHCDASIDDFVDTCPKCHKKITPEASKEVEEIINALEDALVEMKSGKDIARNKANVERYQRKAGMYYGNNPTIVKLLADIDLELKKVAKSSRNQAITNWIAGHKKTTIFLAIVLLIIIVNVISSLVTALTPDSYKNNAQICLEEMKKAIAAGDISKAEAMYNEYKDENFSDSACDNILGEAYFEAKNYKTATKYNRALKAKVVEALINEGKYTEAEEYGEWGTMRGSELIAHANRCIAHMVENGVTEVRIRAYIAGIVKKTAGYGSGPEWYEYAIEKSLLKVAGLKR